MEMLPDECFTDQKWYSDDGNAFGSLDNLKVFLLSFTILPSTSLLADIVFVKKKGRFLSTTKCKQVTIILCIM